MLALLDNEDDYATGQLSLVVHLDATAQRLQNVVYVAEGDHEQALLQVAKRIRGRYNTPDADRL